MLTIHDKYSGVQIRHRVKLSINNHIEGLVHKNHVMRTCLMYHAACKVEFQIIQTVVLTADIFQLFIKYYIYILAKI